ncbi:MAG: hypothetical protein ACLRNQ_22030 [Flavonifractor plautii]
MYAVVPASGDGAHLEQDVKGLLWSRGGELARFTIVIADGGLDGTGRAVAAALLARGQGSSSARRSGWGSTSRHEKGPPYGGLFLRAGAGRRISGAAKRTKLRLPVDKSGHR